MKTLAKTGSTTGAIVIAALFAANANPSTSRRFQAPLIPRAVGISASMANTDRLCRAISTRPFLPRLHPLCSALRHPVLRGYPSYSVTPLINPLGSIVLPRILFAVPLFRHVPFLRVSFRCILFLLPPPRRNVPVYLMTERIELGAHGMRRQHARQHHQHSRTKNHNFSQKRNPNDTGRGKIEAW